MTISDFVALHIKFFAKISEDNLSNLSVSQVLVLVSLPGLIIIIVVVVVLFLIGIITFDSTAKLHNTFDNPVYQNEQKLKTLIDQKFKNIARNWGTRIDKAQKLARDKLFTPSGGDRPRATNVMLIFTDGKPTGLKKSDFTPFTELRAGLEVKNNFPVCKFVPRVSPQKKRDVGKPCGPARFVRYYTFLVNPTVHAPHT